MLLLTAAKGYCMAKSLRSQHVVLTPSFLRCTVHGLAGYLFSRITTLTQGVKFKTPFPFTCGASRSLIEYLNIRAWLCVLRTRHAVHKGLISLLREDCTQKAAVLSQADADLARQVEEAEGEVPAMLRGMIY